MNHALLLFLSAISYSQNSPRNQCVNALMRTMTALGDGVEAGGRAVEWVREKKIPLECREQAEESKCDGGKILLSDAIHPYPRVIGPAVVARASELALADYPDSAEKAYILISLEARSWLELGGDRKSLPVLEPLTGHKDEAKAERWRLWLDYVSNRRAGAPAAREGGREMALYKIGQAYGKKPLSELEADPVFNKAFVDFLIEEADWILRNFR